jgi:DNA-binding protein H-NS
MAKRALNFSKMELAELVQLRDEIETALSGKILMEREELQSRIADLTALERRRSRTTNGHTTPSSRKTSSRSAKPKAKTHPLKGRKAEPKYRGPDGDTWAGRGLAPKWLTDLEKKGKKREQYLIAR